MTIYKKISVCFAFLMLFQLTDCSSRKENLKKAKMYPQMSTATYDYESNTDEELAPEDAESQRPMVVADDIFDNYITLGIGLERQKISEEVQGGKTIITTETWTRKTIDPWIAAPALATIAGASYVASNYSKLNKQAQDFYTYLTEIKPPHKRIVSEREQYLIDLATTNQKNDEEPHGEEIVTELANEINKIEFNVDYEELPVENIVGLPAYLNDDANRLVYNELLKKGIIQRVGKKNSKGEYSIHIKIPIKDFKAGKTDSRNKNLHYGIKFTDFIMGYLNNKQFINQYHQTDTWSDYTQDL